MADVAWSPQPGPQTAFLVCPVYEIIYGGARGGGKSDAALGHWLKHSSEYGVNARGIFFRHTLPQLDDIILRSKALFPLVGATWKEQDKTWVMPGGGILKFRHLENEADAENYMGHSYSVIYAEEAGNWASPAPLDRLKGTLRSSAGVRVQFILTCNPGGPGHQWIKKRYIDPAPKGYKVITDENGLERIYIPAKVSDNRKLLDSDPKYVERLKTTGSAELVRAWLEGDWDVVEGAYFPEFSIRHHVFRLTSSLPSHWVRFRAFDWGSASPGACLWFAVSDGEDGRFPRGALVVYDEWYVARESNGRYVGLKQSAEEIADGIIERDIGKITYSVCDPSCAKEDGGPSIMERMETRGVLFMKADNTRLGGWDQVRSRLRGDRNHPMLYISDRCTHLIRTLPALQHDRNKPEDCDTDGEDHLADALRYGCMSRPYTATVEPPIGKKIEMAFANLLKKPSLNELWEEHETKFGLGRRI